MIGQRAIAKPSGIYGKPAMIGAVGGGGVVLGRLKTELVALFLKIVTAVPSARRSELLGVGGEVTGRVIQIR